MAQRWIMVRLRQQTHDDLVALRESLLKAFYSGRCNAPELSDGISLSDMIDRLIRHIRNDQRRKIKSKKNVRARARG